MAVSIPLYRCTTWTLTKRIEKELDRNYTRILPAILIKSWRQQPMKQQQYGHLPPISQTIQVRRTRYAGHCWGSKDELISDNLLWTSTHRRASVGWSARTYLHQLCADTGCSLEDLPEVMDDKDEWRERERELGKSVLSERLVEDDNRSSRSFRWNRWWYLNSNSI